MGDRDGDTESERHRGRRGNTLRENPIDIKTDGDIEGDRQGGRQSQRQREEATENERDIDGETET